MTESIDIVKGGKPICQQTNLVTHINEEEVKNISIKNNSLKSKKEERFNILQLNRKTNTKQQTKKKNKASNVTKKLNVSNMFLKYNRKKYEQQIHQLSLILKQSLSCPTLTEDELKTLFMKYKSDGHYRVENNLPPFTTFLDNTHNVINQNKQIYNQYVPTAYNTEKINYRNIINTTVNPYYSANNENQPIDKNLNVHGNIKPSCKDHLSRATDIPETSNNIDNRLENKCYVHQLSLNNNNYSPVLTNHDIQTCSNVNTLDDIQNFEQLRSNLDIKNVLNREDLPSCNFTSTQNVGKEYHSYRYANKNMLYNIFDSSVQYESFNNDNISQQNDTHCTIECDDLPATTNFYNNTYSNKWNVNKNDNQFYRNVQSACIPHANLKSYYDVNNFTVSSPMTSIKNYFDNENNFNSHCNNVISTQQDFNRFSENLNTTSDTVSETNASALFCADIVYQYM